MIESDLATFLEVDPGLSALVDERIFPTKKPPTALGTSYPCVTFFLVTSPRDHTHDAVGGMEHSTFQFSCWGKTYLAAKETANAVRAALDNYRGTMGTTIVHAALKTDEGDILDPALGVGTDLPHGVRLDFLIMHND